MKRRSGWWAVLSGILLVGCGPGGGADAGPTDASPMDVPGLDGSVDASAGDVVVGPPVVRFRLPGAGLPIMLDVPFPSDLYLTGPTHTVPDDLGALTNLGRNLRSPTV